MRAFLGASILMTVIGGWTLPTQAALICEVKPDVAFVLRPGKSSEFYALVRNEMRDEAVRCCVACLIYQGDKVLITNQGFMSHTIRVLEGKFKGCRGDIAMEYIDSNTCK